MSFFDHESIFFTVLGYPLSYLEFFGVVSGAIAVWLSARGRVLSWPIGLINVTLLFFLFFQIQLYPDMFLQVFFFITNVIGWWRWTHPRKGEEDRRQELRVSWMPPRVLVFFLLISVGATILFGLGSSNLHRVLPQIFSQPGAYPYVDSMISVLSVGATYLMVQKKAECWLVWLLVDIVATALYFNRGVLFLGVEYLVFCGIAAYGFWSWRKEYLSYQ